jgi:hypothetical protein
MKKTMPQWWPERGQGAATVIRVKANGPARIAEAICCAWGGMTSLRDLRT